MSGMQETVVQAVASAVGAGNAIPANITITIRGPYEEPLTAWAKVLEKIVEKQTPEVAAELTRSWIEFCKPAIQVSSVLSQAITQGIAGLLEKPKP